MNQVVGKRVLMNCDSFYKRQGIVDKFTQIIHSSDTRRMLNMCTICYLGKLCDRLSLFLCLIRGDHLFGGNQGPAKEQNKG
jgi:hypothetical protein